MSPEEIESRKAALQREIESLNQPPANDPESRIAALESELSRFKRALADLLNSRLPGAPIRFI